MKSNEPYFGIDHRNRKEWSSLGTTKERTPYILHTEETDRRQRFSTILRNKNLEAIRLNRDKVPNEEKNNEIETRKREENRKELRLTNNLYKETEVRTHDIRNNKGYG